MLPNELGEASSKIANTAMVAGEVFVPGASEFAVGNIRSGTGHLLAGLAATALLPTMPLLAVIAAVGVRVNSYRHSTTGAYLWNRSGAAEAEAPEASKSAKQETPKRT